jgi:hypothetical protein
MGWTALKAAIASIVKTNGNQEITGALLQQEIFRIIDNIGGKADYAGIATTSTNPSDPDGNVYYLASEIGTYSHFMGTSTPVSISSVGLYVISNISGVWVKTLVPLPDYEQIARKGQANGYAPLGSDSKVPNIYLPSYVDDVIEGYYNVLGDQLFYYDSSFETLITGELGKIYVSLDTNKSYRWSGSVFVYITSGAVDSVNGKTGLVVLDYSDVGASPENHTHSQYIDNSTNQSIDGVKSFVKPIVIPTPIQANDGANKDYVDTYMESKQFSINENGELIITY